MPTWGARGRMKQTFNFFDDRDGDFVKLSVSGQKDSHVKRTRWLVILPFRQTRRRQHASAPVVVVMSNFQAEFYSHLVGQKLFSFAALQRCRQHECGLRFVSKTGCPCLHPCYRGQSAHRGSHHDQCSKVFGGRRR